MADQDKLVLTVAETAERLHIGRGLAYEMVREGVIPAVRLGRRIVVPVEALKQWLADAGTATAVAA